jgi:hypothetical protein
MNCQMRERLAIRSKAGFHFSQSSGLSYRISVVTFVDMLKIGFFKRILNDRIRVETLNLCQMIGCIVLCVCG